MFFVNSLIVRIKQLLFCFIGPSGLVDPRQSLEEEVNLLDKEITSLEAESGGVWGENTPEQPTAESIIPEKPTMPEQLAAESMIPEQNAIPDNPQSTPLTETGPSTIPASQQPTAGHLTPSVETTPLSKTAPPASTPAVSQPLPSAESAGYQGEL